MPNIKFNYLYRDGANYKNYGFVLFHNPQHISIEYVEQLIRSKLIDGEWFYANEWKLPDLHNCTWDNEIDHTFHEFESVEYTFDVGNTRYNLEVFIKLLKINA